MAYEELLVHSCDIYHLQERTVGGGYGVPGTTEYYYSDTPDESAVPCYFYRQSLRAVQGDPGRQFIEFWTVQFLPDQDVRKNDKVIWKGDKLKLHIPDLIRDHHWEVTAERDDYI